MTIGNERGQLPRTSIRSLLLAIGFPWAFRFRRPVRATHQRRDFPWETPESWTQMLHSVLRDIDPILRNSLERGIRWRGGVPSTVCVFTPPGH